MRIVVIGAGPTGLGAGCRLAELGGAEFAIYEQNAYAGGLSASFHDPAGFVWDLGVHVTHSHYHYFDDFLHRMLPGGYLMHERRSWIWAHQRYIPYPFQYNIRHLPPDALWDCISGLMDRREGPAAAEPRNFDEWILSRSGTGIARHFMVPYNSKIWRTPPAKMNCTWVGDRVPATDLRRVLRNVALAVDDVSWGPNSTFLFPLRGGTGAIWDAAARQLPAGSLRLSTGVAAIDTEKREVRLTNGDTDRYDHLVSTLPLPELARLCGRQDLAAMASRLRHTHVKVVGVAPRQPIPEMLHDKTWVYCPGGEPFYRMTPFSTFSPHHVPDMNTWCSALCEVSFPGDADIDDAALVKKTLASLGSKTGILPHDTHAAHTYVMDAPYGYPIPTLDRDEVLGELLPAFEQLGIYSRGRFGGWKYEVANMDHCFMQGVEVADRLVRQAPEKTLFFPSVVNAGKQ
jgi:protoporphyrinogen oxidase